MTAAFQPKQRVEARYAMGDRRELGTILRTRQPYPVPGYYAVRFDEGGSGAVHETMLRAI